MPKFTLLTIWWVYKDDCDNDEDNDYDVDKNDDEQLIPKAPDRLSALSFQLEWWELQEVHIWTTLIGTSFICYICSRNVHTSMVLF